MIDSLTFDRTFTVHLIGMCMHRVFCQLDEALHCTTACSWLDSGSHRYFLTTFEVKLNGMFD